MAFLRNLLATITGIFISIVFFVLLSIVLIVVFASDDDVVVKPKSILTIKLDAQIRDHTPDGLDPFGDFFGNDDAYIGLDKIVEAIDAASYDSNIIGISIEPGFISGGLTQLKTIRNAIEEFKWSGKKVFAYSDFYGQKEYYLSSVADQLFMSPLGEVDFKGLATEVLFYKDFQDKYGLKMEVVRHGKYKSAVEPFLANEMSKENREQISTLFASLWGDVLNDVSKSRNITVEKLNECADKLLGRNANSAIDNNLADAQIYSDEYLRKIKEEVLEENINFIDLDDYVYSSDQFDFTTNKNKIAVVYAQGDIIHGEGDEFTVGQELFCKTLERINKNNSIKAVVLRVNSPGGSALASDLIWRSLELTKANKTLVVSMGDYAASGGYYISCNADKIIAQPTTITGSIGVYGMMPNISEFSKDIGIHSEKVQTNSSPSYSVFHPIDKDYYTVTQESVENVYTTFLKRVAEGRNMKIEQVDKIAQGRVWSGVQAKKIGLVDELGGLNFAIEEAAHLANIRDYKIVNYPKYDKDLEDVFDGFPFVKSKKQALQDLVGKENYNLLESITQMKKLKGIQARLPYVLDVK